MLTEERILAMDRQKVLGRTRMQEIRRNQRG
jgi:hypothetical protein